MLLQRMVAALGRVDGATPQVATARAAPLACVGPVGRITLVEADDAVLVVDGHPQWDADATTGHRPFGADHERCGRELIDAYRRSGAKVLDRLGGDFALALYDRRNHAGIVAVDPIGVRSLAYVEAGGWVIFASSLDAIAAHASWRRELDAQAIFDYAYFHVVPGPRTIFRGARRLMPGHYLELERARSGAALRCYWQPTFADDGRAALATLESDFVRLVERATTSSAAGARCGAFLSGGTDSSTVSGMLGRVTKQPAETFSIGFAAEGYDEMSYARIAARHFATRHHEYYVTPLDVVDAAPKIADAYDQPFGNASAIPAYHCARLARQHGIERLLAGDGGDELYGGNERYAKQQLLGYYQALPAALRAGLIEPLLLGPDFTRRLPLLRKARRYVEQGMMPMPQRYESGNQLTFIGVDRIFEPDFLATVDREDPHRLMREAHQPFADCSLINQMLGIDMRFILADGDLPKVTRTCELAGVDVGFPFLDRAVVSFAAGLPSHLKLRRMQLRWFFKHALRGFLPAEVIAKKKHGFGLPVGVWLTTHRPLFDLARDALTRLAARGIVQPRFVQELTGPLLLEHPSYYGTLLWVLMMLGLWLDARRL